MKSKRIQFWLLIGSLFISAASAIPDDLKGVSSPTDGYIKGVQFILTVYRENGGTRTGGTALQAVAGSGNTQTRGTNTESMRVADGQAAFIGSSKETPIPVETEVKTNGNLSEQVVQYKRLESGVELRPHLMGRYVQLEIVEKNETWNDQTKAVDTSNVHSVVTLPLDQWSKVKGTLNDNEDIEDIYKTNRERGEELWVKIELAPN